MTSIGDAGESGVVEGFDVGDGTCTACGSKTLGKDTTRLHFPLERMGRTSFIGTDLLDFANKLLDAFVA